MKHLKMKLGWEFFFNQRATFTQLHSIALIFEVSDQKLFKIKRFIKKNPSLLLKTKCV